MTRPPRSPECTHESGGVRGPLVEAAHRHQFAPAQTLAEPNPAYVCGGEVDQCSSTKATIMGRAQRFFCSTASQASRAPAFEASRIIFRTSAGHGSFRPRCQETLNNPGASGGNFCWRSTVELRFLPGSVSCCLNMLPAELEITLRTAESGPPGQPHNHNHILIAVCKLPRQARPAASFKI